MTIQELYEERCNTPHNIDKHLPMLRHYALKCRHITEFGTDIGFSTTAFLSASPEEVHCYDINFPRGFDVVLSTEISPPLPRLKLHKGNTLEVDIDYTDLLFIDTEHTYKQVKEELGRHGDKARKYIVLHDIVAFPCIVPAIREWLNDHPEWVIREWSLVQSGLAVLQRSETLPVASHTVGEEPIRE